MKTQVDNVWFSYMTVVSINFTQFLLAYVVDLIVDPHHKHRAQGDILSIACTIINFGSSISPIQSGIHMHTVATPNYTCMILHKN